MAAICTKRASLLVAICLFATASRAEASLRTQLENHHSIGDVVATVTSIEICESSSAELEPPTSSGQATSEELEAQRRAQLFRIPGLADESSSSSAATSPTDGGSVVPPFLSQESVLPGELEIGTVVAMKAMIPPDPPPSGLLKPPRAES